MRIKNQKDFGAGVMFTVVGVAFGWGATSYNIGEAARMGPGYFPLTLGVLMALLGLFIAFEGMVLEPGEEDGDGKIGRFAWRPLSFIIASNVLFGLLLGGLPKLGLPAMGLIAASDEFKWKEVLILATVLSIFSYFAFVYLLKLQFQVWPSFIVR